MARMGLRVPQRIHIIPVGHEYDRVVEPPLDYRADRVALVGHVNDDKDGEKYWNKAVETFEQNHIELSSYSCDIFDLYASLGTIAEIISEHREDEVYVNVASGSKITAIAGMIASMVLEATPYYPKVRNYEKYPNDIERVTELPKYPIDSPDPQQIAILEFISKMTVKEGPPTKGDVIHFSDKVTLPYIQENVAGKGKYRLLDSNIVTPLKERNYILESKSGRNKILNITEEGSAALEAFRWLVGDAVDWEEVLEEMVGDSEPKESQ